MKNCIAAVQYAWTRLVDMTDVYHARVDLALRLSHLMDEIVDRTANEWKITGDDATQLKAATGNFFKVYTQLAHDAIGKGQVLFDITTKMHYLAHAVDQACYVHPNRTWCYSGEDYMQKARTMVQSSAKGLQASAVVHKYVSKWRFAMDFLWDPRGQRFVQVELGSVSSVMRP